MSKRLYTGFSFWESLSMFFARIAATVGLIYALLHFEENPVVIAIVSLLCLLLIVFIGDDQITVYSDRIVQKTNSLASLFYTSKGKVYAIKDIKQASLQPPSTTEEIGATVLLAAILPKQNNRSTSRPIFLDLKNGETVRLNTDLNESAMRKIVELVNSLIHT
jgi:xanthosine utilization system XapX-like protein